MRSQVEILHQIRDLYAQQALSIMVGAGFSKNAIKDYPLWDEMLYDLALELYERKIEDEWEIYRNVLPGPCKSHDLFINEKVSEYIHSIGYLNIVSEYIHAKGFRESIDVYIEKHMPYIVTSSLDGSLSVRYKGKETPFKSDNLNVHRELLTCEWKEVFTTNYDNLLDITNDRFGLGYEVYKTDYELKHLGKGRGIIKVHGSLAKDTLKDSFEFDSDRGIRYIISKEDYETYAEKHQAFSYLMSTTLLIKSFLLIGFSGNDPNFLGWLEWMKDILDKEHDKGEEYKVYLITLGEQDIPLDRQLFYKNHRICLFNILDKDVQAEIFGENAIKSDGNTINRDANVQSDFSIHGVSESFSQFFRYLYNGVSKTIEKPQESYSSLWQNAIKNSSENLLGLIRTRRETMFIPNDDRNQDYYLQQNIEDKHLDKTKTSLIAIAINDLGLLPFTLESYTDDNQQLISSIPEFKEMLDIQTALVGEGQLKDKTDAAIYANILYHLYRLEYTEAEKLLDKWDAKGDWVLYKAALIADFNDDTSRNLLEIYIAHASNLEYKFRASVFANIYSRTWPQPYSYNEFKLHNTRSLWSISDGILTDINKDNEKINPYGSSSRTLIFNPSNKKLTAIKYLVFLVKTGFRIGYKNSIIVDNKKWYSIFRHVFEKCPYPCLYYSLQVCDDNTIIRIGQDFAYSLELYKDLPTILEKLLKNIIEEKKGFPYTHALLLSKELFIAVKEQSWFDMFFSIYSNAFLPNVHQVSHIDPIYKFVLKSFDVVSDESHLQKILISTVKHLDSNPILLSELLYQCGHLNKITQLSQELKPVINKLLSNMDSSRSYMFLAVLSKFHWISEDFSKTISQKIIDDSEIVNNSNINVLHTLTYLTNNDERAIEVVKKAIMSKNIWDCGIEGKSATEAHYLALNKICPDIKWNTDEITKIMSNIDFNLKKLENAISQSLPADKIFESQYIGLLDDMLEFVTMTLPERCGYKYDDEFAVRIRKCIEAIEDSSLSYVRLYDADNDVSHYIQYLAKLIDANGAEKYQQEILMIITRVLMKVQKNLNLELSFLEWILHKHWDELKGNQIIVQQLFLVLYKYENIAYKKLNLNLPMVYQNIRYLATVLKDYSSSDDDKLIVEHWLTIPDVKRFNDVVVYEDL